MSLFVRVVAHYGSNESNDSLGVFSDLRKRQTDNEKGKIIQILKFA